MFCKRETCAKIRFDFRVSPAGNISLQSLFQSIIQIFEPAQEIKIAFSCSRIFQPDIFVDQDVIPDETDIVSDQLPVTIIGEDDDREFMTLLYIRYQRKILLIINRNGFHSA